MRINKPIIAVIICAVAVTVASSEAYAKKDKEKTVRIRWEKADGVVKYQVQISDESGAVVIEKVVEENYIDFILPPGKYRIRIGAYNIFEKVDFWSGWSPFEIKKSARSRFFSNGFPAGVGLKIMGGMSYNMMLSPWDGRYDNTYQSYRGIIGYHFEAAKALEKIKFFRYTGIELEGSYTVSLHIPKTDYRAELKRVTGGFNIFFKTKFKIPLNLYARFGSGLSYSLLDYVRYINTGSSYLRGESLVSFDPYARAGFSVELNFLFAMSLDVGADYYAIFYRDKLLQELRFFGCVGFRI